MGSKKLKGEKTPGSSSIKNLKAKYFLKKSIPIHTSTSSV